MNISFAHFLHVLLQQNLNNEKLVIKKNSELIELQGRPTALKRSFENLIQNGLIYGSNVYVDIIKGIKRALVTIDDDGPGIPKSEHENVFKPFYKIDKSRNETKSSVGLGLSIASDIIQSHGGNIKLDKSSMNGLQVRITLPF